MKTPRCNSSGPRECQCTEHLLDQIGELHTRLQLTRSRALAFAAVYCKLSAKQWLYEGNETEAKRDLRRARLWTHYYRLSAMDRL